MGHLRKLDRKTDGYANNWKCEYKIIPQTGLERSFHLLDS